MIVIWLATVTGSFQPKSETKPDLHRFMQLRFPANPTRHQFFVKIILEHETPGKRICVCREFLSLLLRTDTYAYIIHFRNAPFSLLELLPKLNADSKDPGFSVLMTLFKSLGISDYRVFFLLIAAFQMLCICRTFRKYSPNYWVSIFLFVASTDYLSWMFNGMRQFIAVTMLFGAFDLIVQRRYKMFAILVLLTSQIHGSAILMLPLAYVMHGPALNRKTMLMIAATVLVIPIIFHAVK